MKTSIKIIIIVISIIFTSVSFNIPQTIAEEINDVQIGAFHTHNDGVCIWINGKINGVQTGWLCANLSRNNPNFGAMFDTALTAKVLGLPTRIDVENMQNQTVRSVIIW